MHEQLSYAIYFGDTNIFCLSKTWISAWRTRLLSQMWCGNWLCVNKIWYGCKKKTYFWSTQNTPYGKTSCCMHNVLAVWFIFFKKMHIDELLHKGKKLGRTRCTLGQVVVRMGKVLGDMCRWERNDVKDTITHTDAELMKEFWNIVFSTIRWADDLGYDPKRCVQEALIAQLYMCQNTTAISLTDADMTISHLLDVSLWLGRPKNSLEEIIIRMGKVFGDICRRSRNYPKDVAIHTDAELMKELGNMILSTIKRCDDLGYDVHKAIDLAITCQEKFVKR